MASTSSIFWMYAWSNSAMHHMFFPPRLQVVAFEQDSNGFTANLWNQLPLDGLLGNQSNCPSGSPLGCSTARHRDNPLLFGCAQYGLGAMPRTLIQRPIHSAFQITLADIAYCLRCQSKALGDPGGRISVG